MGQQPCPAPLQREPHENVRETWPGPAAAVRAGSGQVNAGPGRAVTGSGPVGLADKKRLVNRDLVADKRLDPRGQHAHAQTGARESMSPTARAGGHTRFAYLNTGCVQRSALLQP